MEPNPTEAFRRWIQHDRDSAWEAARYDREQRDQITSRIRFGSVVFNGASLLTLLNAPALLTGIPVSSVLASAAFFLIGVVCAGYSLIAHQTVLIATAGNSSARALALDRAVALMEHPRAAADGEEAMEAVQEAHGLHQRNVKPRAAAIWLQNISTGAWLGGASVIVLTAIGPLLPTSVLFG